MSPLPSPSVLLFDLDGTLVDSREDIAACCNHALVTRGRAPLSEEQIASFVGDGAKNLIARALDLPANHADVGATLEVFLAYYAEHPAERTRFLPGAREALRAARRASAGRDREGRVPVALVTNKTKRVTEPLLHALGVAGEFDAVVAGGDDAPLKPSPVPLRLAAERVGADPARAWMIGDGSQDLLAGRALGCITVAVAGGFHPRESLAALAPDVLLDSLLELPALLAAARAADR